MCSSVTFPFLVIATLSMVGSSWNKAGKSHASDGHTGPLTYPDEHITERPNPTPCPEGQTFCDVADDYPTYVIKDMLKNQPAPKYLLGHFFDETDEDFNRFSPGEVDVDPLCLSEVRMMYPKKAKSRAGVFEYVVNVDNYVQGVRVESCKNHGEGCKYVQLPLGQTSRCVQKHIIRTLVIFNRSATAAEGFVTEPFEFPSCCSCVISMNEDRIGSGDTTNRAADIAQPARVKGGKSKK